MARQEADGRLIEIQLDRPSRRAVPPKFSRQGGNDMLQANR